MVGRSTVFVLFLWLWNISLVHSAVDGNFLFMLCNFSIDCLLAPNSLSDYSMEMAVGPQ